MNVISGRVVLKETGLGIPDLLVVLYDADPGTRPEEAIGDDGVGDRIGSRLTDERGAFELTYEDDEFRVRTAEERRPDLIVRVLAPEETKTPESARALFTSVEVRQNAGRVEQYLIRVPEASLTKAGVPIPLDHRDEPEIAVRKIGQAVRYRVSLEQEARRLTAEQVAATREQSRATDSAVEARLVESLTGLAPDAAAKANVIVPGQPAEPVVWATVNRSIDDIVNAKGPLVGYLVLSTQDAERFRDGNGNLRTDVRADEIEPFLYGSADPAARPLSLTRAEPAGRAAPVVDLFVPASPDDNGAGGATGNGAATSNGPLTKQDVPRLVGELVDSMIAPEDAGIFGPHERPDAGSVQSAVDGLALRSGPADEPAVYDFHQLQIAFDYVKQQAIDDGVLEIGKALARRLVERGGDPVALLAEGGDPVMVLREEARQVGAAHAAVKTAFRAPGTAATDLTTAPPLPPRPPITKPPFGGLDNPPTDNQQPPPREPHELLEELDELLNERYRFEVFAPGSTNFGLLVTYRQSWVPRTYQVGQLVKTLTLAPKETRKVSVKRTVKRERVVKELEANQRVRKDETSDTMRDEAEIVRKAQNKTTFNLTAKGSYDVLVSSGDSTTTFNRDADASSAETKKAFRESVAKAAQEFKDERKLEVETKETFDEEISESSEIVNPNEELTVTYLFYELQRRYCVFESIHRLLPVVLVAMEVPNPSRRAIDKVLLAHAWIINRVLLDDRYRPALQYLSTRIVGDELALREMLARVQQARLTLATLTKLHSQIEATMKAREDSLRLAIETRAGNVARQDTKGWGEAAWDAVVGAGDSEDLEAARIREDAAKEAYERAVREEQELRMRLDAETAALDSATDAYARAYAEHANHLLEIAGLRAHFKENVLYYMQAIWSYTPQDQLFFSLCDVRAPRLEAAQKTYELAAPDPIPLGVVSEPGQVVLEVHAHVTIASSLDADHHSVSLAEIADLDTPLGFKGNYMIFPLKRSNPLTDFMMVPYIDSELGLRDPDDHGNWTPESFAAYARELVAGQRDKLTAEELEALEDDLRARYRAFVSDPRPATDEIVVPTDSLYIEALPGSHPLLEDFKLAHRVIDVKKAQAETRKLEMENLRYAARIVSEQLGDPEIEKRVVIGESAPGIVVDDG